MRLSVKGRNIEITDAIRAYVEEKIGKISNHYDQISGLEVTLSVVKNPSVSDNHVAEVLCKFVSGAVHVSESAESMYAAIDLLADKLNRSVKKFKDKHLKAKNKTASIRTDAIPADNSDEDELEEGVEIIEDVEIVIEE